MRLAEALRGLHPEMRMSDGTTLWEVAHMVLKVAPHDQNEYRKVYLREAWSSTGGSEGPGSGGCLHSAAIPKA